VSAGLSQISKDKIEDDKVVWSMAKGKEVYKAF
jgi:hypothetical protein